MEKPPSSSESMLQRRLALEQLVASVSSLLVELNEENCETILQAVLRRIGGFAKVARSYLFQWVVEGEVMGNTHEWCAPGRECFKERLQALSVAEYPWWIDQLESGEVNISDTAELPPAAAAEKRLLDSLRIRSAVAVPLRWDARLQGYLGLDFTGQPNRWSKDDIQMLKVSARLLADALRRLRDHQALAHSKSLLETAQALTHVGSWEWDAASGDLRWSTEVYRISGEVPGRFTPTYDAVVSRIHPEDRPGIVAMFRDAIAEGRSSDLVTRITRADGESRRIRVQANGVTDTRGRLERIVGTVQDVTELARAEEAMLRANRALQTISACNAALVRASSEPELLEEICRILVERGEYRLAWILLSDEERQRPSVPDAYYGEVDQAFFGEILASDMGSPPCVAALAGAGQAVVVRDIAASRLPHRERWLRRGMKACIGLPLQGGGKTLGLLAINTTSVNAFDEDEIKNLKELADDLAYGIAALRSRRERDEARHYLEATEQSLRNALERETDGVIVLDRTARILFANPAGQSMLGRPLERLQGEPFAFPVVAGEKTEITLVRPDGSLVIAEMRAAETEWYKVPALVISMHDVTEQRRTEEQLRIWATVLERSGEIIFVTDAQRRIIAVNRAFESITGYTADEAIGRDPHFLDSGLDDQAFHAEIWRTVNEGGHWQGEIRDRRKNGEILPLWLAITAASDMRGNVQHYIAIGSDVSERKAAEERIHFLAYHDALTGLPNRVLFKDRLTLAAAHAKRSGSLLAVLFLDLDRFKNINDSLGHDVGDELLTCVAERLVNCVRSDDTVSRQGGDEFLLLLSQIGAPDDAAQVAGKILGEISEPYALTDNEVHVSASIGIAVFPADGTDPETLVRNADAAMYYAKERGRNNYQFFIADLNRRVSTRLAMENALRHALERQEFELYYQPQVNVRTNEIVGVEALLRWHHAGKIILPTEFVGLAEETGLIVPIGEWVMREACRQSVAWQQAGVPFFRVAVNLSAAQFRQRGAFERLRAILTHGCDPSSMEVELTEGTFMQEAESSLRTLSALKDTGVGLAIDDFGTGYSNLNYLRRFPIDRLKVDQSFVRDLTSDPIDRAVTEAIIVLARTLNVAVVAEGVETEEERKLLEERDCEVFQGFLFTPPLPASAIVEWWRGRQ